MVGPSLPYVERDVCQKPHPHHRWVFCHREPMHKGRCGAVALNPGQWLGNKPPGTFATLWGKVDD